MRLQTCLREKIKIINFKNSEFYKLLRVPLVQFSKFNNFFWVRWFLGKNLSNFVSPVWKLHNVYCLYTICVYRIPLTLTYINYYWLFSLGKLVAINPFKTICFSLSLTALCGLGLFSFYEEKDLVKLWIPENNDFATNHQWLIHNFPPKIRHVKTCSTI